MSATKAYHKILAVGEPGSGKSTQVLTLPGRVFAYCFDPNAARAYAGYDIETAQFLPDFGEVAFAMGGLKRDTVDKAMTTAERKAEPKVYENWVADVNRRYDEGFFDEIDWLIIDSLTSLSRAIMQRLLWIQERLGRLEDLGDYRIAGSKMSEIFGLIASLPVNLYCTGHITSWQDDKTKEIQTILSLPGSAKTQLPILFSDILLCTGGADGNKPKYEIRTRPDRRGLKSIRTNLRGLDTVIDVSITDWNDPRSQGLGRLIQQTEG